MKLITLLVSLIITSATLAQLPEWEQELIETQDKAETSEVEKSKLNWYTSLDDAKDLARKSNRSILVFFTGSDWCAPCISLKKDFFETEEFLSRADNFVLLMIDYPRRKDIISPEEMVTNRKIIGKYNKSKTFPKLVMLNKNGNEMGKLSGYSSYSNYKDTSHHFTFIDKYISK